MPSEEQWITDLNKVLSILRKEADPKTGILAQSCRELVVSQSTGFSINYINRLINRLTRLGWREEETLAKGRRGSKIRLGPANITSLEPLADVAEERAKADKLKADAMAWYQKQELNNWVITSETGQAVTIKFLTFKVCKKQDDITRQSFSFELVDPRTMPGWLKKLLTSMGTLGVMQLYQLSIQQRAKPKK